MRGEDGAKAAAETNGGALADADDAALLRAAAGGSAAAFSRLVARHYDIVHRVTWRITSGHADTEDIVQDAFVRLWNNPAQVREAAALRAWLIRVASNLAIDRARRKPWVDLDSIAEPEAGTPDALEHTMALSSASEIDRAIAALPERQRLALVLVHFEGQSNIDAARAMEVSVEAVESLLARARRTLKERLKDRGQGILEDLSRLGK
jgi:RNA polymerase sigma-70 factor (ECF subfamily)